MYKQEQLHERVLFIVQTVKLGTALILKLWFLLSLTAIIEPISKVM